MSATRSSRKDRFNLRLVKESALDVSTIRSTIKAVQSVVPRLDGLSMYTSVTPTAHGLQDCKGNACIGEDSGDGPTSCDVQACRSHACQGHTCSDQSCDTEACGGHACDIHEDKTDFADVFGSVTAGEKIAQIFTELETVGWRTISLSTVEGERTQ